MTLDESELRHRVAAIPLVRRLEVVDSVGSTNDALRELALAGAESGTVVVADRQLAGRGRLGRSWHSAPGLGLYLSVLLRPREPIGLVTRWTLGAGLAVCEACRRLTGCPVTIDWPNDVIWEGRKLAGILAEHRWVAGNSELVLGIGVNVRHRPGDFPEELADTAVALTSLPGSPQVSREQLAATVLEGLAVVHDWLRDGNWPAVAQRWLAFAPTARGRRVRILPSPAKGDVAFDGTTAGVDETGALLVCRAPGDVVSVHLSDAVRRWEG